MVQPQIMNYLFKKAGKEKVPLSAAFEISPECNMNCKMCYVKMTSEEMKKVGRKRTVDEWLDIAKQAQKLGLLHILLTGGEPFLRKDFKELYLKLKQMGFVVSINSNGTMINEEIVSWLSQSPPDVINISLYGASNDTYKRLCNNSKGLDQVKNAVNLLRSNNINVKLNASITPYNIDDLDEMFEVAKELDVTLNPTAYMFPPSRRDESLFEDNFRLDAEKAGKCTAYMEYKKLGKEKFKQKVEYIMNVLKKNNKAENNEDLDISCRAGKSTAWITWDGKMMSCGVMENENLISYPFEKGFEAAWKDVVEKSKVLKLNSNCVKCAKREVCYTCGAACYDEEGSFEKVPNYLCKMTDARLKGLKRLYETLD